MLSRIARAHLSSASRVRAARPAASASISSSHQRRHDSQVAAVQPAPQTPATPPPSEPMVEMFGVLIPDRKIPERVVENIVDNMRGGIENPLLPEFLKLKTFDTESLVGFFNQVMSKSKPEPYETRYPNVSLGDATRKLDELYATKVYTCDERFQRFFIEGLGFTQQDFDEIVLGQNPQLIRPDGSINFQEASRYFGFNRDFTRRWKQLEMMFENFERIKKMNATPQAIDWAYWEEQLGTDAVEVHKKALNTMIRNIPIFPVELFLDLKKSHIDPLFNQMKDSIIDELPFLEKLVEEDVRMGEFHEQIDRDGDISIEEYLDKYVPQARNEIDLEIENENWDFEYQDELRAVLEGKSLADFVVTKDDMREFTESKWDEVVAGYERTQVTGTTPLERVMKEYARAQDDLKRIEAQISSMKGKDEQPEEEAAAASTEEKQQEDVDREAREKDPFTQVAQKYIIEMYKLEPDYFEKQAARDREAREKAAAEKAAAEKAAAEAAAAAPDSKKKKK